MTTIFFYLCINSVEFIKTWPSSTRCQAFEKFGKGIVMDILRTIESHTLFGNCFCQVFDCFCLSCCSLSRHKAPWKKVLFYSRTFIVFYWWFLILPIIRWLDLKKNFTLTPYPKKVTNHQYYLFTDSAW